MSTESHAPSLGSFTEPPLPSPESLRTQEGPTVTPEVLSTMKALSDPSMWGSYMLISELDPGQEDEGLTYMGFSQAEIVSIASGLPPAQANAFQEAVKYPKYYTVNFSIIGTFWYPILCA